MKYVGNRIRILAVKQTVSCFICETYESFLLVNPYTNVTVVQLDAVDPDFGDQSDLRYTIAEGNENEKFIIDSNTGLISVKENKNLLHLYKLKATVTDGIFSTSIGVNIKLKNLPITQLHFSQTQYYASIKENTSEIKKLVMIQVFGYSPSESIQYSILNQKELFDIGKTSGV
ncbi:unnamed protein product, partial [Meganyctiphanes norvegica]